MVVRLGPPGRVGPNCAVGSRVGQSCDDCRHGKVVVVGLGLVVCLSTLALRVLLTFSFAPPAARPHIIPSCFGLVSARIGDYLIFSVVGVRGHASQARARRREVLCFRLANIPPRFRSRLTNVIIAAVVRVLYVRASVRGAASLRKK